MNNNSKFNKNNSRFLKYIFYISNVFLVIFYLFPGSILGCFIYNDCKSQPQLTSDFGSLISSNHVYVFAIISLLGFFSYSKKTLFKYILSYLCFISLFLELTHLIIPQRGFELKDLAGNFLGVVVSLFIFLIFKSKKNELI